MYKRRNKKIMMTPEDYILGIVHDGAWSREEFAEVMKEMPATLSEISLWMEGYAAMVLEEYIDSKDTANIREVDRNKDVPGDDIEDWGHFYNSGGLD
jgi:hypothetical protein